MSKRMQRIGVIALILATLAYTFYNYTQGTTGKLMLILVSAFSGFLLVGHVTALIREWNEK